MVRSCLSVIPLCVCVWLAGCSRADPPEPLPTLTEVAQTVQFASTDKLGPHHYLATVERTEHVDGQEGTVTEETVDIRWQDWDNFSYTRFVDGRTISGVSVVGGRAWVQNGANAKWKRKDDAEPYRVRLRATWNAWDFALEPFLGRIEFKEEEHSLIEGRPAVRYSLGLTQAEMGDSLSGHAWLDEATAVRLEAEVDGLVISEGGKRAIRLSLIRTGIGQVQTIIRPGRKGKQGKQ